MPLWIGPKVQEVLRGELNVATGGIIPFTAVHAAPVGCVNKLRTFHRLIPCFVCNLCVIRLGCSRMFLTVDRHCKSNKILNFSCLEV